MVRSTIASATIALFASVPLTACGLTSEDSGGPSTLPTLPPSSGATTGPPTTPLGTLATTTPPLTAPTGGPNTAPPIPGLEPTAPTTTPTTTVPGPRIQYVAEPPSGTLHVGHQGNRVRTLQGELNQVGYQVSIDGYFGRGTEAAVAAFQQSQGLPADGVAGPDTQARLTDLAAG